MKIEFVCLLLVLAAVIGVPLGVVAYDNTKNSATEITLVARTPANGNWSQREIHLQQGERVRIRLTSEDVSHGFLVPDLGIDAGLVSPGKFTEVEFTADRLGTVNFYCNTLCSNRHGAMWGKIIIQ